ncbi:THAP domain-containing protein 1-like [Zerene cesonia]|uniref:THAP domain-containing protein 1-like n=1 Tax=Zerene cesonia TaxID=33412 RepID=UPI0018E59C2C|nr:THAP domain-containing protein 1-like [Zerene cesonia]
MPKCALKNCKNITSRTLKRDGISYFRFPRDPIRCAQWTTIISQQRREEYFKPNRSSVVCSEHFLNADMYDTTKGMKRLRKTAVPNIIQDMTTQDFEIIEKSDNDSDTDVSCTNAMLDQDDEKKLESPTRSLSKGSILHTPRNIRIKSELDKCRKRLIIKEKVINNLKKKYTTLLKKTVSLKNQLNVLRKKLKSDSNIKTHH